MEESRGERSSLLESNISIRQPAGMFGYIENAPESRASFSDLWTLFILKSVICDHFDPVGYISSTKLCDSLLMWLFKIKSTLHQNRQGSHKLTERLNVGQVASTKR